MLLLAGNLNALKLAVRTPRFLSYCHSPKMDGSVAHPLSSVTCRQGIILSFFLRLQFETYQVLVFTIIAHGGSNTASCKASINGIWLYVHLQHQIVANFSAGDVVAIGVADAHATRRRWSRVGNCAGCGQHGDVEADRDVLRSSVVHTSDSVSLRLECDQLGMLLYHQDEVGFSLKKSIDTKNQ